MGSLAVYGGEQSRAIPFFARIVENALDEVDKGRIEAIQAMGGGGLGDLAIRYGYQRFNNQVMVATIVVLVVMVQIIQMLGDRVVRALVHRR